jgi:hypothetical protein
MKRTVLTATAALSLLLGGCATTIRSDVTTFHQWPAQLPEKTYVFEAPPPQDDTLELRSYQNLVRAQLDKLGFQEATGTPALKVSMRFTTTDVPIRVVQAVDPFFYPSARFAYIYPYPYHRRFYGGGGWYSSFYDPFWGGIPRYEVSTRHNYQRDLQVAIRSAADNHRLFDVTVHNPGPNGASRRIELKQNG